MEYINLNEMNLKKALKLMMIDSGIDTMSSLARLIDKKETTFRSSINNESLRLKDFLKISELMGYEVIVNKKE